MQNTNYNTDVIYQPQSIATLGEHKNDFFFRPSVCHNFIQEIHVFQVTHTPIVSQTPIIGKSAFQVSNKGTLS